MSRSPRRASARRSSFSRDPAVARRGRPTPVRVAAEAGGAECPGASTLDHLAARHEAYRGLSSGWTSTRLQMVADEADSTSFLL